MRFSPLLNCREAARLMTERLDAPLGRLQRLRLRRHLALCRGCTTAARQFEQIHAAMRGFGAVAPNAPFREP